MGKPSEIAEKDLKSVPDAEILALSLRHPALFEELVERYQRPFLRKAVSILRDEEAASDVVQETFVRIYSAAKRFEARPGATFSSWGYAILVNQCFTAYRKRQKREAVSLDLVPEMAEILPDEAMSREAERRLAADHVMSLLSRLPVILRRAVEMHFLQGLPEKEIAEREGVSHGVIRNRIYRAKKEMRKIELRFAYAAERVSQGPEGRIL